jgi:hypothetical protein
MEEDIKRYRSYGWKKKLIDAIIRRKYGNVPRNRLRKAAPPEK